LKLNPIRTALGLAGLLVTLGSATSRQQRKGDVVAG